MSVKGEKRGNQNTFTAAGVILSYFKKNLKKVFDNSRCFYYNTICVIVRGVPCV
ncbi:hypothetical protein BACCAP_02118 [Pseudoflavonifractor capillosus ATCC 29799]|uniref:Uncharacterized protein n=1 Tax=Pseudoflavonifractor capillosus ATCC 29799 TaxID=411467 RepID=A6NV83_9FIRM|nr:hypothetical protein BACCAP_02118 [Pseudoflavonifractor capillosus ATCC 29799]